MYLALVGIVAFVAALVGGAPQPRQNCPEATRFGIVSVSPTNVSAGDILTVTANFNCAINTFGIVPQYTDYYIESPGNIAPILLARRTPPVGSTSDSFTVAVPDAYYSANTGYIVMLETTYPVIGTKGVPYLTVGGIETGITINV